MLRSLSFEHRLLTDCVCEDHCHLEHPLLPEVINLLRVGWGHYEFSYKVVEKTGISTGRYVVVVRETEVPCTDLGRAVNVGQVKMPSLPRLLSYFIVKKD